MNPNAGELCTWPRNPLPLPLLRQRAALALGLMPSDLRPGG